MWFLNQYYNREKIIYKIVRNRFTYENWELIDTYILDKNKFVSYTTYIKRINLTSKKPLFKRLLEFFNKL